MDFFDIVHNFDGANEIGPDIIISIISMGIATVFVSLIRSRRIVLIAIVSAVLVVYVGIAHVIIYPALRRPPPDGEAAFYKRQAEAARANYLYADRQLKRVSKQLEELQSS